MLVSVLVLEASCNQARLNSVDLKALTQQTDNKEQAAIKIGRLVAFLSAAVGPKSGTVHTTAGDQ